MTWGKSDAVPRRHFWLAVIAIALSFSVLTSCSNSTSNETIPEKSEILVAAASDLRFAFTELGNTFTAETGIAVRFTFGSSGQLREQIINGAPFDVFASANEEFVDDVVANGRAWQDTVQPYALGRLALRVRSGRETPTSLADLVDTRFERIAIANPAHAPYGIAAQQALENAGVYTQIKERLIFGENVSDTLRLVETGNVDAALVALSLVINSDTPYELIDEQLHKPLHQSLVVTRTGANDEGGRMFARFLSSSAAQDVMKTYGFELSQEGN